MLDKTDRVFGGDGQSGLPRGIMLSISDTKGNEK